MHNCFNGWSCAEASLTAPRSVSTILALSNSPCPNLHSATWSSCWILSAVICDLALLLGPHTWHQFSDYNLLPQALLPSATSSAPAPWTSPLWPEDSLQCLLTPHRSQSLRKDKTQARTEQGTSDLFQEIGPADLGHKNVEREKTIKAHLLKIIL